LLYMSAASGPRDGDMKKRRGNGPTARDTKVQKPGRDAKWKGRGYRLVAALRGKGTVRVTTDQVMAMTRG
jgi:hypothetical protein